MKIINIVYMEAYQILVASPDESRGSNEILTKWYNLNSHDPVEIARFDSYDEAVEYAEDCAKKDSPFCQKLFTGGYALCGNVFTAEQFGVEDGEIVEFMNSCDFTHPFKGKEEGENENE